MKLNDDQKRYFEWLCWMVDGDEYHNLLNVLFEKEFYGIIQNDINRGESGKSLRSLYILRNFVEDRDRVMSEIDTRPCSVFEMLISLAMDISDMILDGEDGGFSYKMIFWEMIRNLGLEEASDKGWFRFGCSAVVNRKLDAWLERYYCYDGGGGLFPLKAPLRDQRKVEIWAQAQNYVMENYNIMSENNA